SHPLSKIIPDFSLHSYYAGINMAFAEVVGMGCKQLALSSPYSKEMAEEMLEATEYAAKEYGTVLMMEPDLLVSKLFPPNIAKDKTVILIAHDQSVLDEYQMLKKLKIYSNEEDNPDDLETEIAQRFGALLSYDEATINRLIAKNG
ncbi:MAG: hypothetical protein NWF07_03030, partial [Candidatus Bathyarchaeota archaeon]|nr:hypothetical protein [Candidatus Bathyarchaeota archaeon]